MLLVKLHCVKDTACSGMQEKTQGSLVDCWRLVGSIHSTKVSGQVAPWHDAGLLHAGLLHSAVCGPQLHVHKSISTLLNYIITLPILAYNVLNEACYCLRMCQQHVCPWHGIIVHGKTTVGMATHSK